MEKIGKEMRYKSLDGLRGIASVTVVLHHCLYVLPEYWHATAKIWSPNFGFFSVFRFTPLTTIINGGGAVLIFFVLSGFVLTVGLERGADKITYLSYVTNRFIRIYPAFAISILISFLLAYFVKNNKIDYLSRWFSDIWSEPLTMTLLFGHLTMIGTSRLNSLNNVMWSLVVELRIAVFMPVIYRLVKHSPKLTLTGFSGITLMCLFLERKTSGVLNNWVMSFSYVIFFAVGSYLFLNIDKLKSAFRNLRTEPFSILLAFFVCLYSEPFKQIRIPIVGAAAIFFVAISVSRPSFVKILSTKMVQYLGQISYSLYLIHLPTIVFIIRYFTSIPVGWRIAIGFISSFICAHLFYMLVERPFHFVARALSNAIAVRHKQGSKI